MQKWQVSCLKTKVDWERGDGRTDGDTLANSLKEGLLQTAEEVLGRQRKKIQPWVTNEVLDLCDQRRQLKQKQYTSTEVELEYRKVNREVRKKMKAAKEEWTGEQCKNIEKEMMSRNSNKAYNTLKAITKTRQHKSAVIEDRIGNILTESTAILNRWTVAYTTTSSIQTLAYSRVTRPLHKRLKTYLC